MNKGDRAQVYAAVHTAIQAGRLVKRPCRDCGGLDVEAHHEDYSKPLEVIWLCQVCHGARHGRYPRPAKPINPNAGLNHPTRGRFVSTQEAAKRLGVSHARLRHFIVEGRIKAERLSPRFAVIAEAEVERFAALERKPGRPRKEQP